MNYHLLSEHVKQYSLAFFNSDKNEKLLYHDLTHTEGVVKAATQIGNHYQLSDEDFFIVFTAVWFHDMGYLLDDPTDHEHKGAEKAATYLQELGVDEPAINKVMACILSTAIPQSPITFLEQIVCDADMFHLGTDQFSERSKLMRKEFEAVRNVSISKDEWRSGSIELMQSHFYHTEYCQSLLNIKKQENLDKLLRKQNEHETKVKYVPALPGEDKEEKALEKSKKKSDSGERPDKGIETMFRIACTNQQRLSDMSDNKAHIMISVNSIIISVIIGLVVRKMDASPNILLPTLILLTGSMIAVIFAVLATRPNIPDGQFTKAQVDDKTVNLLFFGNFYRMDFSDYNDGMLKVMADREFLYGSLIRDIHGQGKVLGRKYKLLRISYTIFMFTLIVSIIAFAIATIFFA